MLIACVLRVRDVGPPKAAEHYSIQAIRLPTYNCGLDQDRSLQLSDLRGSSASCGSHVVVVLPFLIPVRPPDPLLLMRRLSVQSEV